MLDFSQHWPCQLTHVKPLQPGVVEQALQQASAPLRPFTSFKFWPPLFFPAWISHWPEPSAVAPPNSIMLPNNIVDFMVVLG